MQPQLSTFLFYMHFIELNEHLLQDLDFGTSS